MDNKLLAVIIGSMLVLGSGVAYVLIPTGKSSTCSTGWVFQETGAYEGQYMCKTTTSYRYNYCSNIKNSLTKQGYYCDIATLQPVQIDCKVWICSSIVCVCKQ